MSLSIKKSGQSVEFIGTNGQLCGTYHYEDMFKSFFRGLYTPGGKDVVACPPPEHPHHKGLQFGLTTDQANFWEEDEASEPDNQKLPIGRQQTRTLDLLPDNDGIGFKQVIDWVTGNVRILNETRTISVVEKQGGYVWTWVTSLIPTRDVPNVQIIKSVYDAPLTYCSPQFGYCGLGLRLARELFENSKVLVAPSETGCGQSPKSVSFQGDGAAVTFEQDDAAQGDVLFLTTYQNVSPYGPGGPGFGFMGLVPIPCDLMKSHSFDRTYFITVSDV